MFGFGWKIFGRDCHCCAQGFTITHTRKPAVVRNVQPFVGVGCPGIGFSYSLRMMKAAWCCNCPESKGPVHIDPGAGIMRFLADDINRIECARIDVPCLNTHNGRSLDFGKLVRLHSSLIVNRYTNDTVASETEKSK